MKRSKDDDRDRERRRPPSPEERVVSVFFNFLWLCFFKIFVNLCYRDHIKHQNKRMNILPVDAMNLLQDEKSHLQEDTMKEKVL